MNKIYDAFLRGIGFFLGIFFIKGAMYYGRKIFEVIVFITFFVVIYLIARNS